MIGTWRYNGMWTKFTHTNFLWCAYWFRHFTLPPKPTLTFQTQIVIHFKLVSPRLRILGMLAVTYYIRTVYDIVSLYICTSVKSEAHMCCADVSNFGASTCMNSALNSSVIQHLEHCSVIKIRDWLMLTTFIQDCNMELRWDMSHDSWSCAWVDYSTGSTLRTYSQNSYHVSHLRSHSCWRSHQMWEGSGPALPGHTNMLPTTPPPGVERKHDQCGVKHMFCQYLGKFRLGNRKSS